ncbi:hypothetical protein QEN19_000828 [Hanseniaspora menglaensis]
MDNLNFNEEIDNMINKNSASLSRDKTLNTAKLIEMFFVKTTMLVSNSKSTKFANLNDESFDKNIMSNIETFYTNYLQNEEVIKLWQNIDVDLLLDQSSKQPLPLVIETYLDLINLEPTQNLYISKSDNFNSTATSFLNNNAQIASSVLVCKGGKKSEIVLERWLLELDAAESAPEALHFNTYDSNTYDNTLEQFMNNKFLIFLRYLVSLLKVLPSQELFEKLIGEEKAGRFPSVKVCTRIIDGSKPILSKGRIGLSKVIIGSNESHLHQKNVIPLETDLGLLRVNVSYRKNVNFFVADQHQVAIASNSHKQLKQDGLSNVIGQGATHVSLYNSPVFQHASSESFSSLLSAEQHIGSIGRKSTNSNAGNINRASLQYQSTFKVGSVGSIASNTLTRNPSNSSVIAALRAQRSSNGSNNGLNNATSQAQNQLSSDSIDYNLNNDNIGLSSADKKTPYVYEKLKSRPGIKSERKSSKSEVSLQVTKKFFDINDNSPDVKEFLDLISDDGIKSNSIVESSSMMSSNNNWNNSANINSVQSITDSLIRFKMMKADNIDVGNSMSISLNTGDSVAMDKQRNASISSETNLNIMDQKKYSFKDEDIDNQPDFNQFGFSPTRHFDAEQLRATLDRSRRGSIDSSKKMVLSSSKNSLYSHCEPENEQHRHDDAFIPGLRRSYNDSANDFGVVGSFSSVTSPRDINNRRPRGASTSSVYSMPKFYNSLTSNKFSGSPGSHTNISYSSQNVSRRTSIDRYAEPIIETSTIYANFEKPKSYSKNSSSSLSTSKKITHTKNNKKKHLLEHQETPVNLVNGDSESINDTALLNDQNKNDFDIGKSSKFNNQLKHPNISMNNDDDDLLFFMGDSN